MKINLPDRVAGVKDALFVLEVELPIETTERTLVVTTEGALEALDLQGTSLGGTYTVPVGVERLHIPIRVTEDGTHGAKVNIAVTAGPEKGAAEERSLVLEAVDAAATSGGSGAKLALVAVLVLALIGAGVWLVPKLLGGPKVPDVVGKREDSARTALEGAGYVVRVRTDETGKREWNGLVLRTIPASGERAAKGESIEIVLGSYRDADRLVPVPNVVGAKQADAIAALDAVGFQSMVRFIDPPRPEDEGHVVSQSPADGRHVTRAAAVELFVGRTRPGVPDTPETVPDTPEVVPDTPEVVPDTPEVVPDTPEVVPDTPEVGPDLPAVPDTPETVPDPPETVPDTPEGTMPSLIGCTESHAQDKLDAIDLYAIVEMAGADDASQVGKVITQEPAAGTALAGRPIIITVGIRTGATRDPDPDAPETVPDTPETVPDPPETVPDSPETVPDPPETVPDPPETVPDPPETVPDPPETVPDPPETVPDPPETVPDPPETVPDPPAAVPDAPEDQTTASVPDLIGLDRIRAESVVKDAGFRPRILLEVATGVPDGQVLSQEPGPGEDLRLGGTVRVIVARRPPARGVSVPNVVGMYRGDAERALRAESFLVRVTYAPGSEDDVGKVDAQAPRPGSIQHKRTWVEIVVIQPYINGTVVAEGGPPPELPGMRAGPGPDMSDVNESEGLPKPPAVGDGEFVKPPPTPRGPEPIPPVDFPMPDEAANQVVPDLVGESARDAITRALAAGLAPVVQLDRRPEAPVARVVTQDPAPGTALQRGAVVRITAGIGGSTSERTYDLKLVAGAAVERAREMYERAGITVDVVEVPSPSHPYAGTRRVVAQWPVSSVPVSQARTVTLWVVTQ